MLDADLISKLAHWDLLELLPQLLGCTRQQMATLASVPSRAKRAATGERDKLFASAEVGLRALNFLGTIGKLPPPNVLVLQRLQGEPAIDAGEALLIASSTLNDLILTGDKRSVEALSRLAKSEPPLTRHMLCLEHLLLRLLAILSVEVLRARVRLHPKIDKAVLAIFGSQCQASEADIREGLQSYIRDIEGRCAAMHFVAPPYTG